MIVKEAPSSPIDPDDLSGPVRAPRRLVDRPIFFDFGDGEVKPNKEIDTTLSTALFRLPASGERLGSVGERIVAEVITGLIEGDRTSHPSQKPAWRPFLPTIDPAHRDERFLMAELLRFAGVA